MTTPSDTPTAPPQADAIDQAAGLHPGDALFALRRQREKIVDATQGSYAAMFAPEVAGISVAERLLIALHASRLAGASALADHYRARLQADGVTAADIAAADDTTGAAPATAIAPRLRALLTFTAKLTRRPIEGDQQAVDALLAAGLATPAAVAVGQLIAFVSYQVRLQAGLRALNAAGVAA